MTKDMQQNKDWPVPTKYNNMKNPYPGAKGTDQVGWELFDVRCKLCQRAKGWMNVVKQRSQILKSLI